MPPHVCMVVISNIRFDARVYREAKTLVDNGYDVTVIAYNQQRKSVGLENMDGIQVLEIPWINFKHKNILYRRLIRLLIYIKFRITLYKEVFSIKPDIYHAHNINTLLVTFLAARFKRKKLIFDAHELWTEQTPETKDVFHKIERIWGRLLERLLINRVDRVITVNESIAQVLASRYHIPMPIVLMNCAYTVPEVRNNILKQRLRLNDNKKIILYQGRYSYTTKALENLVLSAQFIPNSIIVFIGYGDAQRLHQVIKENELDTKVKILNPVSHQEIHEYVSLADIGVIPLFSNNLNNYLSTPSKLFEYLMGGVAIVASDLPEIRKIVDSSSAGIFFNSLDPQNIARVINEIIEDENRLKDMKKNARQSALTKYNWEMESRKLLELYKNLSNKIGNIHTPAGYKGG